MRIFVHEFKIRVFYQIFQRQYSSLFEERIGMISVTGFTDNADGFFLLQFKREELIQKKEQVKKVLLHNGGFCNGCITKWCLLSSTDKR